MTKKPKIHKPDHQQAKSHEAGSTGAVGADEAPSAQDVAAAAPPGTVVEPEAGDEDIAALRKKAAERDDYLDRLQRAKAEYSNYQKRVLRDHEESRKFASQDLVTDLLPVLDDLDRALEAGRQNPEADALIAGVEMVRTHMVQALARHGVEELTSVGEPFDPSFHEAMMQHQTTDHPPGTVMMEAQKGYTYNGRVVRPSKVVVAGAPDTAAPDHGPDEPAESGPSADAADVRPDGRR